MKALFGVFFGVVLVNNFVLSRFLGLCPYIGVSRRSDSAIGMGMAVVFVMTMASAVTWVLYSSVLQPNHLEYLRTIVFILVIAALVQLVEMVVQKVSPALYHSLGIYLPLITTNCAVLGVTVLNVDGFFPGAAAVEFGFLRSVVQGFGAGVGFMLAMILMSGIRERLELVDVPESLKGVPVAFITAGLMSMAFMGFLGMAVE